MNKLIWAFAALCPSFAVAQAVVLGDPAAELVFEQIPTPDASLIGGAAVTPEEWPGVFYTSQGSSRC